MITLFGEKMGWLVAGIICCNIGHGTWGTILIIFGLFIIIHNITND